MGVIFGLAGAAVVIAVVAVAGTLIATSGSEPAADTSPAVPVANGVSRPDASCVTTDGTDRREYWDGNGWWAGRVDGEIKEMSAYSVLALKLGGHQINSAWICAPRSNG